MKWKNFLTKIQQKFQAAKLQSSERQLEREEYDKVKREIKPLKTSAKFQSPKGENRDISAI